MVENFSFFYFKRDTLHLHSAGLAQHGSWLEPRGWDTTKILSLEKPEILK